MTTWPKYAPTPRSTTFPYKKLSYSEQIAAYKKRKDTLTALLSKRNIVPKLESNSGTQAAPAMVKMYMTKIDGYQKSIDFSQKMLKTDLMFVMDESTDIVDMTTFNYACLISDNEYLQCCWRQAFAIEFPDECADVYRC